MGLVGRCSKQDVFPALFMGAKHSHHKQAFSKSHASCIVMVKMFPSGHPKSDVLLRTQN